MTVIWEQPYDHYPDLYAQINTVTGGFDDPLGPTDQDFGAIGAMWVDTSMPASRISARSFSELDMEVAPLVNCDPTTPEVGLGLWLSRLGGVGLFLFGGLGNPPSSFGDHIIAASTYTLTTSVPQWVEVRTDGETATCYYRGELLELELVSDGSPATEFEVPDNLKNKTKHGLALDGHWVAPAITNLSFLDRLSIAPFTP